MKKRPFETMYSKPYAPWRLTLIIIAIGLLLMAIKAGAQSSEPFKGAKKIVFTCNKTGEELYKSVGQYLASQGYNIVGSNPDFLTMHTGLRATSKFNYSYLINIAVVDNKVSLTMQWKMNSSPLFNTQQSGLFDWRYRHGNSTADGIVYNDVNTNFKSFQYSAIEFY